LQQNKLHIVSFDIPDPPDYGGAIDVFYKIKALAAQGAEIYLHCFSYGRKESELLKSICKEVWYYPRKTGFKSLSIKLPYIVASRKDKALLKRLTDIDAPILFEGVHTSYYLNHPSLAHRKKAIRVHNIEHEYYRHLSQKETNTFRQLYFSTESRLLRYYEGALQHAQYFFPLSLTDTAFFKQQYPSAICEFIAPFQQFDTVKILEGTGDYILYQGNLSHPENKEAVLFLLKEVFPKVNVPVVIAGRKPAYAITSLARSLSNCTLIADPSQEQMQQLIQNAQIHILPTFQSTGMKLKLLYVLFAGRHVLVNDLMLHGTGLEECCIVANSASDMIQKINSYKSIPFSAQQIEARKQALMHHYSNSINAQRLLTYLLH